ncbi:MAG: VIT domain-containing protein [bacterium]|nr:VIT domain-containing protein [bacterium]
MPMPTIEDAALGKPIAGLPLLAVRHRATVVGLQQEVVVTQEYGNDLDHPVEAVYVFPLPAEAAVLGVEMQIGEKKVVSELRKREDAVRAYEVARDTGHHAALLEQERPNIFTMSVAGIEPGEAISVTVRYLAPVDWQDSGGRLSIPLVVAPRFIPGVPTEGKSKGSGWAPDTDVVPDASRITPQVVASGVEVPYTASVVVVLNAGFPCHVESPSHGAMVAACDIDAGGSMTFSLVNLRPDRDVIFTYRTTSQLPTVKIDRTSFTPAGGAAEEFVLLQLTPSAGQEPTDPLDVVLVLDRSGSMKGPKIAGLKRTARKAIDRLATFSRPVRLGVISFSGGGYGRKDDVGDVTVHVPLATIDEQHREAIDAIQAGGGTMAGAALTTAMREFGNEDDGRERCIILISDGETEDRTFTKVSGVRVHAIGIDTAVNDDFLKDVSRQTGGGTRWFRPGEDFDAAAAGIAALASGPVIRGVELRGLPKDAVVTGLADLYASQPTTIAVQLPATVRGFTVVGRGTDGKPCEWAIDVPETPTTEVASRIWARKRLTEVKDPDAQVALSLRYGIVCSATAFVAVSLKAVPGQKPERVDIPVLLPETWDYDAVFGSSKGGNLAAFAAVAGTGLSRRMTFGAPGGGFLGSERLETLSLGGGASRGGGQDIGGFDVGAIGMADAADDTDPAIPTTPQLLEHAERFLVVLEGGGSVEDTEWQAFTTTLAVETFQGWSDLDRARLYEVLATLRTYGRSAEIPKVLEVEPSDVDAQRAWKRARRGLGYATL